MDIVKTLFENQDLKYKSFHERLIPNVNPDTVIGVRTPILRNIAKAFSQSANKTHFISNLPHTYYEENNVHACLIEQIKDYNTCINELNRFLPYIDNWATCDMLRPKCFSKNKDALLAEIKKWLKSNQPYTIRFAIEMLMVHFLDSEFDEIYLKEVARIKSNEYYVNMMIAWYFATALAKQRNAAIKYIVNKKLPVWVHNKAIQKAIESYRITDDDKKYLKSLKILNKKLD